MTKAATAAILGLAVLFSTTASRAQAGSEGHVNYLEYTLSNLDVYTIAPAAAMQNWMRTHFTDMVVWTPYFDTRTSWYPNATVYQDLYGILPGSLVALSHPDWILHDQYGSWLFIPWDCQNGICPQYAGDIANPAFRAWWISQAQAAVARGNYQGIFIDDANMEFRVGDGWQNQIPPIDSNTGQIMTWDAWRNYVATFLEQIRAAFPNQKIIENAIWYSGPSGTPGVDPYIQRQFATATKINLERGIANDTGLTGGTGFWSVYSFFNLIDRIHAVGKGVNYEEYQLNPAGQEYGLASYFMISTGNDSLGDASTTPDVWFSGYSVDLGSALGPRTYSNGVFQRNFSGGIALLGEPGLSPRVVQLPGTYKRLDGSLVTAVTLGGSQGIILQAVNTAPPPSAPAATGTHYLSDLTPTYVVNGWGTLQKNRSIGGQTLSLNGVRYANGLGVHAYAEQRFALSSLGGCTSLTATVGVDDEVPAGNGSVDFQVWADGFLLYDSGSMTGGATAKKVSVNLAGRQNLAVVVTNGIYLAPSWTTYYDHGDWANPVLTCAQ